jgi:hypothetical protein
LDHFVEKQVFELLFGDVIVQIDIENMPARFVGQAFDRGGFSGAGFAGEKKAERVRDALFVVPVAIVYEEIHAIFDGVDVFSEQVAEFAIGAETFHNKRHLDGQSREILFRDPVVSNDFQREFGHHVKVAFGVSEFIFLG